MYIDNDFIRFYDPSYDYSKQTQDLPLGCPYREMARPAPSQQGQHGRPPVGPTSPPPNFTPPQPKTQQFGATPLAVDQGAIRFCRFRMTYIWPRRGDSFWAWLTFVGPKSVAGFRWNRNRWVYFGMDLRDISSFQCF
ncbi:MAG TPA: hypothetical protein VIM70_10320 [Clostridium sp.]|uniref:hypothetical protein n=1 Tax=Clostridium sp. TaxID=1506 RepID=UPI002F95E2C7